ncbi:MAG TPA: polysaccharide biosynthesis tyrosine autokinase [Longimicrobiales bacterium]|nr:polysaccharide biosynthesis tyrosine autokinase [Longimicrobiales bacterium]
MQDATRHLTNGSRKAGTGPDPIETLFRAVRRHWVFPATMPILLIAGTAAALYFVPRTYEANAQLRIDQQRSNLAVLDALQSISSGSEIETEMVVLRSRTMAESVVDTLSLRASLTAPRGAQRSQYFERLRAGPAAAAGEWVIRPRADGVEVAPLTQPGEPRRFGRGETLRFAGVEADLTREALEVEELRLEIAPYADAVKQFQRTVTVARPNREADVVRIGYTGPDSVIVRDVVNTMVRHFIRRRQLEQSTEAVDMVGFLNQQIDTLTFQLTSAEEALRDYSEQSGIIAMKAQAESWVTRLADLKAQRDIADAERRALASLVIRDGAAASGSYRNIVGFPSILTSPSGSELLRALNEAENVRADMLQRYTPENEEVQMQTQRIAELEDQLRGVATTYLDGLSETVLSLDILLAGYSDELRQIPEQEIRLARLRRHATVLEEIHTLLQTRVKEAEIAAAVHDGSVRVVDPAIVPGRPIRPRPKLSLAFATMLGLGLGIAGAVLRDHADRTVRTRDELQRTQPGLPILSVIPRVRVARTNGSSRITVAEGESPSAEAYRQLRTNLSFARPDMPQQVLVMTSPTPGDGKSMTCTNLAATLAQQGARCILIDADMRRGVLHEAFDLPRDPGLSQVLARQSTLDEAVRTVELPNLRARIDFLTGGVHPPNPAELLGSARMKELVQQCRERYDVVLLDAPPLNLVTDASLMGTVADGVLVVVRSGVTRGDALAFAMDQLEAVRAPVLGLILNDVDLKSEGYYGKYAGYYGREQRT